MAATRARSFAAGAGSIGSQKDGRVMRNDKAIFVGIVMLMIAASAGSARAQAPQPPGSKPATPPSVAPGTDHLDLSVGAGVIFAPRPYVGASEEVIPIPVINIRYKWLFAEGIRGGAQFLRQGKLAGNVYLQANFEGLKADGSPFLAGMENRSKSADAGVEVVYRAHPVGFRVNLLTDVLGRNSGQEFILQAVTGAPLGSRGFLLASIGPRWISANRVDYDLVIDLRPAVDVLPLG